MGNKMNRYYFEQCLIRVDDAQRILHLEYPVEKLMRELSFKNVKFNGEVIGKIEKVSIPNDIRLTPYFIICVRLKNELRLKMVESTNFTFSIEGNIIESKLDKNGAIKFWRS